MQCPRCQAQNREGVRFCEDCGARLAFACPKCGAEVGPEQKFCGACGAPVVARPADPPTSPQAYTPPHLAERILTSRAALEGERKQVTVLFADLKGSMELLADRDPEEARKLLDPVLERMMEAVHRYEGTVNQVLGDGIMALFGAPLAHEDHAVRGCYAALAMQAAIRRYTEEVRPAHGVEVQIRVGLNSGEVVVRAIGNDLHMDYSAIGQTTHLAARMEQLAAPGSIRLTAETLRLAEGFIQVKPLGPVPIKGLAEPVEVFELLGATPAPARWQAAAARGVTRFVGRQAELGALHRALEHARAGRGQVVAVVGEPGVGKTRLFHEFTHSPRTQGWLVLESTPVSYGKASAYLPVVDLLKAYFQIGSRDQAPEIREKVTGKLLALGPTLAWSMPAFFTLLEVPVDDRQWQALDPPQRRLRTLDAVKGLLLQASVIQPLLVVVENLHWIDAETQAFLDGLVGSLPSARLLLLVNYRPEYRHGWGGMSCYAQLRLDPLPPDSAGELLGALMGDDPGLDPLKVRLIDRTAGNPFFLEESVRSLVETQVLGGERGTYRLAKVLPSIQVPATVQAVLAARIDRLPPDRKRLLQCASVIGKDVPLALLHAIADVPEDELRGGLAELQAAEFLYETRHFPDLAYTFKHALTHDVAYGSLLQERRRALHAPIVAAIERVYADRLAEQVDWLAYHAFQGEAWDKAVTYLRQAGVRAMTRCAYREAVGRFEQALAALAHFPETRETLEQAIDLRFDLRHALFPLGEPERGLRYLREAEGLARALDDQRRLGWVSAYMCYYLLPDRATEGLTVGRSARAIAERCGDLPLQVAASYYVGLACYNLGDYREAEGSFRNAMRLLEGDLRQNRCGLVGFPVAVSRSWLATSLANLGAFEEGIAHGAEGLRLAEAFDHPYTLIIACRDLGSVYALRGALGEAARLFERGLMLARDRHVTDLAPGVMGRLGYVSALCGRAAEGLALLRQAVELNESTGRRGSHSLLVTYLGETSLLDHRPEDALAFGDQALRHARERGERGHEASILRLLGEIASRRDPPEAEAGEEHFQRAAALASALGMRPLLARCHLGLGTLFRRTDRSRPAREHLARAAALFREMGMPWWLRQGDEELQALD